MKYFLAFVILLSACQHTPKNIDYDTHSDFSQFHSYQANYVIESNNALMEPRLQRALDQHLPSTTLVAAATGTPADLTIKASINAQLRTAEPNTRGSIGIGGGSANTLLGIALNFPLSKPQQLTDVMITINLLSASSQQVIWQGNESFTLDSDDIDSSEARIEKAVKKLLSQYPPN